MILLRISAPRACCWADRRGAYYWMATADTRGATLRVSRRTLSALKDRLAELRWRARTGRWPLFQ